MSVERYNIFDNSFEGQFARREEIETTGGMAEVVDISPENLKDPIPVFLAPAWACTIDIYKSALETLVKANRRAISLNHPRFGGDNEKFSQELLEKYPMAELRKAFTILEILNEKNIEKTDIVAHSEGAINVAIAASMHPEKFRNIIFAAPAGMIGEDTLSRLIKGFRSQSPDTETLKSVPFTDAQRHIAEIWVNETLSYLKNPIRSAQEGIAISEFQIHDMLRLLHEKGIGIAVISGVDDPVFPTEKMAGPDGIAKADMLDGFLSVRGGHGELGARPELFMTAAESMLTALETKRQKKEKS